MSPFDASNPVFLALPAPFWNLFLTIVTSLFKSLLIFNQILCSLKGLSFIKIICTPEKELQLIFTEFKVRLIKCSSDEKGIITLNFISFINIYQILNILDKKINRIYLLLFSLR